MHLSTSTSREVKFITCELIELRQSYLVYRFFRSCTGFLGWWPYSTGRPLLYVCNALSTFSNISETTGPIEANLIWSFCEMWEQKFVQMVLVTWPGWPPCPYMAKSLTLSGTKRPMTWKLREYYQVCSNDNTELTLTYFKARSNLLSSNFLQIVQVTWTIWPPCPYIHIW